ncbi:hypothetical protein VSU19_01825 [Verrucomicrobiales bacterium BCK34]|nr:hypothetical protein [Verrucomicrobiales bacterium BCK34]
MSTCEPEQKWRSRAASVARRFNTGWWMDRFNILLVSICVALSVLVLSWRTFGQLPVSWELALIILGAVLVALGIVAWTLSRRRFITSEVALVRLDDRLELRNQLISAANSRAPWPAFTEAGPEMREKMGLRWNPVATLLPGFFALLILFAAWVAPLPASVPKEPEVVAEPGAWEQMEEWLAKLEEEEVIDEEGIEELEGKIEELRDQPEDEWFSHASLEATDSLQESIGKDIQEMASDMATLERDIAALETFASALSEDAKKKLLEEFDKALESLEANGMKPDEELLKQLKNLDPSQLGQESMNQLSKEQLESLQKQLGKSSEALGSMEGLPKMGDDPSIQGLSEEEKLALGMSPGSGAINRGRGDAPLYFGDKEDLNTSNVEKVENLDLSRASLGETLGLGETEHEIDKGESGNTTGGAISSAGRGGEAVSRENLLPDEQALLRRYFK